MPEASTDNFGLITRIIEVFSGREQIIDRYWDYFNGNQAKYLERFSHEKPSQFFDRLIHTRVENHCKSICEQIPARLYGTERGDPVISRRVDDQATNDFIHEHIYKDADNLAVLYDLALENMICGHAIAELVLWDKFDNTPFDWERPFNKRRITVKIVPQNLRMTVPLGRPNNPSKLGAIIRYYRKDKANPFYNMRSKPDTGVAATHVDVAEYIDDDWHFMWEKEPTSPVWWPVHHLSGGEIPMLFGEAMNQWRNPFQRVDNRFVVMRAPGTGTNFEGMSMLQTLIPLQDDLNESRYDDMRLLQYYIYPIAAIAGSEVPEDFQIGQDQFLKVESKDSFQYVQPDLKLDSSEMRKKMDRSMMNQVAGISEISRGITENIGQTRSGAAFYVLFSPDILNIKKRLPRLIQFEKELIGGVIRLWNTASQSSSLNPEAEIEIKIPEDVMGYDKMMAAEADQILADVGLLDLKKKYEAMFPDKTDAEIRAMIRANKPPEPAPTSGASGGQR